jgi:molybdenum cofactor biosynthesis protein MoaC/molybdopterin converting factor subunit 1
MTVRVRLYAMLRERAQRDWVELELEQGATVDDALRELSAHEPLRELLERLPVQMAVNRHYAGRETLLSAGDELALIPPVSGGSSAACHGRVGDEQLSVEALARTVVRPGAGAIVVFAGVPRDVAELEYEAYEEMAREGMGRILAEAVERHHLQAAGAEHRTGAVARGEPSVLVAVSAAHREEAFAGAREAIDRIKAELPIWKREGPEGAEAWVAGETPALSHIDARGSARMVDVGEKEVSDRRARARARVRMSPRAARAVLAGNVPKGEVLGVARLAGIQGAKLTGQLIPLAHPLALAFVDVRAHDDAEAGLVELTSEVRAVARTGVEMEAMSACAVAGLTVYDMVKGLERGVEIEQIVLLEKRGGRSDYVREGGHPATPRR